MVGFLEQPNGRIKLNTKHKISWKDHISWIEKETGFGDCFKAYLTFFDGKEWMYLKIDENLPAGNIYISKDRAHSLRRAGTVFGGNVRKSEAFPLRIVGDYLINTTTGEQIKTMTLKEVLDEI